MDKVHVNVVQVAKSGIKTEIRVCFRCVTKLQGDTDLSDESDWSSCFLSALWKWRKMSKCGVAALARSRFKLMWLAGLKNRRVWPWEVKVLNSDKPEITKSFTRAQRCRYKSFRRRWRISQRFVIEIQLSVHLLNYLWRFKVTTKLHK